MSLSHIFDIANSGMVAQTKRLTLLASDLANIDSVGSSKDTAYKTKKVVFAEKDVTKFSGIMEKFVDNIGKGVDVVDVVEAKNSVVKEYNPSHPKANKDGYVFKPKISMEEILADSMSARSSYEAMIRIAKTAKNLTIKTLEIGK